MMITPFKCIQYQLNKKKYIDMPTAPSHIYTLELDCYKMKRKHLLIAAILLLLLLCMGCTDDDREECPTCDGSGRTEYMGYEMECPTCGGKGYIESQGDSSSSNGFINLDVFEVFFTVGNIVQVIVSALISAFTLWLGAKSLNYNIKYSQLVTIVVYQQIARIVFELFNQSMLNHWLGQIETDSIMVGIFFVVVVPIVVSFLYTFKVNTYLIKKVGRLKEKVGKRISWVGTFLMQGSVNIVLLIYLSATLEGELPGLLIGILLGLSAVFFIIAGIMIAKWRKETLQGGPKDGINPPPLDDIPFSPGETVLRSEAVYRDADSVWEALYSGGLVLRERAIQFDGELETSQKVVDMEKSGSIHAKLRIPLDSVRSFKVSRGKKRKKEKYLSIKYLSPESGVKKKAHFIFDRRYIDKYVSSLALGDIAEDDLPMGLSHIAMRMIERMPGRYTGEEGYYDIWFSMIEKMKNEMEQMAKEDRPGPPDDWVDNDDAFSSDSKEGKDFDDVPDWVEEVVIMETDDEWEEAGELSELVPIQDDDHDDDWDDDDENDDYVKTDTEAYCKYPGEAEEDEMGRHVGGNIKFHLDSDHPENDPVSIFFSAVKSYERERYDEALGKYERALDAGLGDSIRGKSREDLERLKKEKLHRRPKIIGATHEPDDKYIEKAPSKVRYEDKEEPYPRGSSYRADGRRMSICPYCGEKLHFPKPPRFCPFCEERILF